MKKYLIDETLKSPLKIENTSQKNNSTHRNKNKKLNTTNLVSSIFFYHRKVSLLLFFTPIKIRWKHVFFKQYNLIGDWFLRKDYFSPSVIWPSLNTKIFVKANSKSKKYEKFFEKSSLSV